MHHDQDFCSECAVAYQAAGGCDVFVLDDDFARFDKLTRVFSAMDQRCRTPEFMSAACKEKAAETCGKRLLPAGTASGEDQEAGAAGESGTGDPAVPAAPAAVPFTHSAAPLFATATAPEAPAVPFVHSAAPLFAAGSSDSTVTSPPPVATAAVNPTTSYAAVTTAGTTTATPATEIPTTVAPTAVVPTTVAATVTAKPATTAPTTTTVLPTTTAATTAPGAAAGSHEAAAGVGSITEMEIFYHPSSTTTTTTTNTTTAAKLLVPAEAVAKAASIYASAVTAGGSASTTTAAADSTAAPGGSTPSAAARTTGGGLHHPLVRATDHFFHTFGTPRSPVAVMESLESFLHSDHAHHDQPETSSSGGGDTSPTTTPTATSASTAVSTPAPLQHPLVRAMDRVFRLTTENDKLRQRVTTLETQLHQAVSATTHDAANDGRGDQEEAATATLPPNSSSAPSAPSAPITTTTTTTTTTTHYHHHQTEAELQAEAEEEEADDQEGAEEADRIGEEADKKQGAAAAAQAPEEKAGGGAATTYRAVLHSEPNNALADTLNATSLPAGAATGAAIGGDTRGGRPHTLPSVHTDSFWDAFNRATVGESAMAAPPNAVTGLAL